MREPPPTVYVVDDDADVLKAIERLLQSSGLTSRRSSRRAHFSSNTTGLSRAASCSISHCRS